MTTVQALSLYRNKNNIWLPLAYLTAEEKRIFEEKENKAKEIFKVRFEIDRDTRENSQKAVLKGYLNGIKNLTSLDWKQEKKLWNKIIRKGGDKELENVIFRSKLNDIFLIVKKYYNNQYFFTNIELIKMGEDELLKQMDLYKKMSIEKKKYRDKYKDYPKYYRHLLWWHAKSMFKPLPSVDGKLASEIGNKEYEILEKEFYNKEIKNYYMLSEEEKRELEKFFNVSREELERKLFITTSTHSPNFR